jgi:hypothetical protein
LCGVQPNRGAVVLLAQQAAGTSRSIRADMVCVFLC